jgi:preprotein translocase subunit SecD
MISARRRFNLYLLLALATIFAAGCRTHKKDDKDKQLATLRIHLESNIDDSSRTKKVPIYRASPVYLTVDQEPILTEAHVASAKVVDVLGGFDMQIQLNRQGAWLFQSYSASNPGKHFALFTQFGEKGKESRWLAAPIFTHVINDGLIQFTPDATREEAEEIARGLNNIAKKNESNDKW